MSGIHCWEFVKLPCRKFWVDPAGARVLGFTPVGLGSFLIHSKFTLTSLSWWKKLQQKWIPGCAARSEKGSIRTDWVIKYYFTCPTSFTGYADRSFLHLPADVNLGTILYSDQLFWRGHDNWVMSWWHQSVSLKQRQYVANFDQLPMLHIKQVLSQAV